MAPTAADSCEDDMSEQSQLIDIHFVVIFLSDGEILQMEAKVVDSSHFMEGGEVLEEFTRDGGVDTAVVLGCGGAVKQEEAVAASRHYFRRVAKWHGDEEDGSKLLFGFDVSQSQVFQKMDEA